MDEITNRITPYNAAAEQSVIGSILINPERFDNIAEIVKQNESVPEVKREILSEVTE